MISIINIFYVSSFILFLFFLWIFFLFFKEKFKKVSIQIFLFYVFFYIFLCNVIIYIYIENIIFFFSILLEENFIIKNPDDWVWVVFSLSTFLTSIFFIPYFSIILYTLWNTGFYLLEQKFLLLFNFFLFYSILLSLFLLATDFIFAGLTSLAYKEKLPFEFQFEIESFFAFIFGTFWDFLFTTVFINIILFIFLFGTKKKNSVVQIFILAFIFYWFGGVTFTQDIILLTITYIFLEIISWFKIVLFFLSKHY